MNNIQLMNNFDLDANRDHPLWRYIDFPRLISLLHTRELAFIRPDFLGDPWEGLPSIPATEAALKKNIKEDLPQSLDCSQATEDLIQFRNSCRTTLNQYAVSCWYMQKDESAAMWDKYADSGLVIQSSVGKLLDSLQSVERQIMVGRVAYRSPESAEWVSDAPQSLFQKRKSYCHEEEFRLVVSLSPGEIKAMADYEDTNGQFWGLVEGSSGTLNLCPGNIHRTLLGVRILKSGIPIPVNLESLVDTIYTSPALQDWALDLVRELLKKFQLDKHVTRSQCGLIHPFVTPMLVVAGLEKKTKPA